MTLIIASKNAESVPGRMGIHSVDLAAVLVKVVDLNKQFSAARDSVHHCEVSEVEIASIIFRPVSRMN